MQLKKSFSIFCFFELLHLTICFTNGDRYSAARVIVNKGRVFRRFCDMSINTPNNSTGKLSTENENIDSVTAKSLQDKIEVIS
jgi:hypothetical protein